MLHQYDPVKRYEQDQDILRSMKGLADVWGELSIRERLFLSNIATKHKEYKCLTDGERSALVQMLIKHKGDI